jgi:hypothetical protein
VRCFDDSDIAHVHGRVNPADDIEVVETELILADVETVEKRIDKMEKSARGGDKSHYDERDLCHRVHELLGRNLPARNIDLKPGEEKVLRDLNLLTAKKVLYVANVDEPQLRGKSKYVDAVEEIGRADGSETIVICGDMEAEIATLPEEDRREFLEDLGLRESGLQKLIRAGYDLLGLITFYTTVGDQLRAWTIPEGTRSPRAAGKIHTDMERGFIRAEILHYEDFVRAGDITAAKEKGLVRIEGRDYAITDGDIVYFRFHA